MDAFNATMARRVRAEQKFSFGFKLIPPVQSLAEKHLAFLEGQITGVLRPFRTR